MNDLSVNTSTPPNSDCAYIRTGVMTDFSELHPDLQEHLDFRLGFPRVFHPLLISDLFVDRAQWVNDAFAEATELASGAWNAEEWEEYIFLHQRFAHLDALNRVYATGKLKGAEYWRMLGYIWAAKKFMFGYQMHWRQAWLRSEPHRESAMHELDLPIFEKFPEIIQVFRGFDYKRGERGLSWTTDRDVALWFAKAGHGGKGYLASGYVHKEHVLTYFDGRNDKEIAALPQSVTYSVKSVR